MGRVVMYDVAVVGSGFAGSILAMIAHRLGKRVVLLEKGRHPRVVIGESSTPLANLMLEELGARYDLPGVAAFSKYGTWRKTYPHVACGLKRGFTFFHGGHRDRSRELLVAASPNDEISDTHWYRADFDAELVRQAREMGVEYRDQVNISSAVELADRMVLDDVEARVVIDATGPRGFLHRALGLGELALPGMPATQALYSHFEGVARAPDQSGPYPVDDAAVHHVFDGGWIWVLRFNNGITSAGVAATREVESWDGLIAKMPMLREQFARASPVMPFVRMPRVTFRSAQMAGERWAMLPSAAGFVDPLLSTGFPLTLLGVGRIAEMLAGKWDAREYARRTDGDLVAASRLIGALYRNMHDFETFSGLTLLYFAAASYAETARRLGKPELAGSFLLHEHAVFGPALRRLCEEPRRDEILRAIEPFDVAGLCDTSRCNWYPVEASDLYANRGKLGASADEITGLLARCGFEAAYSCENTIDRPGSS